MTMTLLRAPLLAVLLLLTLAGARAGDRPPGHAIASAHPLATKAGMDILAAGGNAFDAAVAVTAAIAVVEPTGSGIGGGGFWLLHRASDGFEVMVDGREVAPLAATATMYQDETGKAIDRASRDGPLAAGIPGEPAALVHLAKKYGRLPLKKSLAPAIRLARDGFAADDKLVKAIEQSAKRFSPAAREIFLPGGQVPAVGQVIRQRDLARVIQRIADHGLPGFYAGETARRLLAGVQAAGGIWTADDLHRYTIVEREPVVGHFRDYRLVSASPPSAGGLALVETLQQIEALGWVSGGPVAGVDAERLAARVRDRHQVIEALRRAYRDRAAYLGDPDFVRIPMARLSSRSYALALAKSIDPLKATPSASLPPAPIGAPGGTQTTHFSILDADGNRVAATLSINLGFGSAFMAPGTGVLLNDEMDDFAASTTASNAYGLIGSEANLVAPRKRPLSTMTPTFVEGPNGVLILGTPGGSRIATMVLLGILNFVDGADAQAIVSAPRYHHQYLPDIVQYEAAAFEPAEAERLAAMGHNLRRIDSTWGNLQAVLWRPVDDHLEAAADPRGVGSGEVRLLKR